MMAALSLAAPALASLWPLVALILAIAAVVFLLTGRVSQAHVVALVAIVAALLAIGRAP